MEHKKRNLIMIIISICVIITAIIVVIVLFHNSKFVAKETIRIYTYASETISIEFIMDGDKSGTFSLEIVGSGSADIYTGEFWSDNTTRNGFEQFNLKGYEPSYFNMFESKEFLRLPYINSKNLLITYTLSLKGYK